MECEFCKCSIISNWKSHLLTKKHKANSLSNTNYNVSDNVKYTIGMLSFNKKRSIRSTKRKRVQFDETVEDHKSTIDTRTAGLYFRKDGDIRIRKSDRIISITDYTIPLYFAKHHYNPIQKGLIHKLEGFDAKSNSCDDYWCDGALGFSSEFNPF